MTNNFFFKEVFCESVVKFSKLKYSNLYTVHTEINEPEHKGVCYVLWGTFGVSVPFFFLKNRSQEGDVICQQFQTLFAFVSTSALKNHRSVLLATWN